MSMRMEFSLLPEQMPSRLKLLSAQAGENGRVWLRYEVMPQEE